MPALYVVPDDHAARKLVKVTVVALAGALAAMLKNPTNRIALSDANVKLRVAMSFPGVEMLSDAMRPMEPRRSKPHRNAGPYQSLLADQDRWSNLTLRAPPRFCN